jgi:hypothetical protein
VHNRLAALVPALAAEPSIGCGELKRCPLLSVLHLLPPILCFAQTPTNKMGMLIGMFARLTDSQAAAMARMMNSLSPGQIVLSMQLLEKFNFGVDNIGQNIPAAGSRGSTFNIGPFVQVTTGGAGGAGGLPFGLLG